MRRLPARMEMALHKAMVAVQWMRAPHRNRWVKAQAVTVMRLAAVNENRAGFLRQRHSRYRKPFHSIRWPILQLLPIQNATCRRKILIRSCLRFGSIRPGVLEIGLTEDAPKSFASDLARKLTDWTGTRWSVAISPNAKAKTIAETENAKRDGMVNDAKADPDVAAILAKFPGSKIINIRLEKSADADDLAIEGTSAASEMMPVEPINEDDD